MLFRLQRLFHNHPSRDAEEVEPAARGGDPASPAAAPPARAGPAAVLREARPIFQACKGGRGRSRGGERKKDSAHKKSRARPCTRTSSRSIPFSAALELVLGGLVGVSLALLSAPSFCAWTAPAGSSMSSASIAAPACGGAGWVGAGHQPTGHGSEARPSHPTSLPTSTRAPLSSPTSDFRFSRNRLGPRV